MQPAPPLLQETVIGHLVCQGVLEGIDGHGHQAGLVEELGGLEVRQTLVEGRLRHLGDGLEQRHGHVHANDRGDLQEALRLRRQVVDARGQHRLHGGRQLELGQEGPWAG